MLDFITNNLGTIIVSLILLVVVGLIIYSIRKDKKKGKSSCGCGCKHCANAQYCHGDNKN
ncbi:MAG: FeoB-associated Cys-rich membrane protein [Oscillospiraceae bacterium]